MKKIYFLWLCVLISIQATATHFVGYDMFLENVKTTAGAPTNMYVVKLKFYRDITGANIPSTITFSIFKNSNNQEVMPGIVLNKVNPQGTILVYNPADCPPVGFLQSIEYGLYESAPIDLSALNDPAGYYLSSTMCCRNNGIVNLLGGPNSSQYGATFTMDFPALNATSSYKYNSSPQFKKHPLAHLCVGKTYTLDWKAQDPDGDSLRFSFTHPLDFNNDTIFFGPGYGLDSLIDGTISINPATGIMAFHATMQGKYQIAVRCEEYRAGVKIGETRREIQIDVVVCNDMAPVIGENPNQHHVTDTIYFGQTNYQLLFTGHDTTPDTLTMEYLQLHGDNLIAQGAHFGVPNVPGLQFKIEGRGTVQGEFKWNPDCSDIRKAPYNFDIVVSDRTCPVPLYDTLFVSLYVVEPDTTAPVLYAQGDTFIVQAHSDSIFNYTFSAIDTPFLLPSLAVHFDSTSMMIDSFTTFTMSSINDMIFGNIQISLDCILARPEPYTITVSASDDICQNDISSHTFQLFILPCMVGMKNEISNALSVYPNPTSNDLYIDNKNNIAIQQLQLLSIEGKEIFNTKNISSNKIDVSDLPEGLYLLRLQTSDGVVQKKVSIVH